MQQRVRWLDTAKGIGILLVVAGHCLFSSIRNNTASCHLIYEWIYAFHMPFFVFLSGCSFSLAEKRYLKTGALPFIRKKAKSFLLPYFTYNILVYLFFMICSQIPALNHTLSQAGFGALPVSKWLQGLFTGRNVYCHPTWYLFAMFLYSVIAYGILRLFPVSRAFQRLACAATAALFLFAHFFTPLGNFSGTQDITYFLLWFFLGWQFYGRFLTISRILPCLGIPLIAFFISYYQPSLIENPVLLHSGKILMRIMAVLGIVSLMPLLRGRLEKLFHFLGCHSMEIYLFHQPFIGSCIGSLLYSFLGIPAWYTVCITTILSLTLPLLAGFLIKKLPKIRILFSI